MIDFVVCLFWSKLFKKILATNARLNIRRCFATNARMNIKAIVILVGKKDAFAWSEVFLDKTSLVETQINIRAFVATQKLITHNS